MNRSLADQPLIYRASIRYLMRLLQKRVTNVVRMEPAREKQPFGQRRMRGTVEQDWLPRHLTFDDRAFIANPQLWGDQWGQSA